MKIKSAEYIKSSVKLADCPAPVYPEYAFIGRSNVGKSSLINMLTGRKSLAKISNKPGKTQTINHFLINKNWYLVDLPGYGYAKISKTEQRKWDKFITDYLHRRDNLVGVFVLIDSRLEPQKNDLDFLYRLGISSIPFTIVFTKIDKLSKNKLNKNIEIFKNKMLEQWEEMPKYFLTSSVTKEGRDEIMDFIEEINKDFESPNQKPRIKLKK